MNDSVPQATMPKITVSDRATIPQLGFGTLRVQPDREQSPANAEITAQVVGLALEAGCRHIDADASDPTQTPTRAGPADPSRP